MKKILALILTAVLLASFAFALSSCGVKETEVTISVVDPNGFTVINGATGTAVCGTVKSVLAELGYVTVAQDGSVFLNAAGCTESAFTVTVNGAAATLDTAINEKAEIVATCGG